MAVNVDKQPFLPTVEAALKIMFHEPADVFYTGRVMDLLYGDGVKVDCSSDEVAVSAMCLEFGGQKAFKTIDDHHYSFSLFAGVSYYQTTTNPNDKPVSEISVNISK